jgi:hypothetical protein
VNLASRGKLVVRRSGRVSTKPSEDCRGVRDGREWAKTQQGVRLVRIWRTDWPKEQPGYGHGEKVLPKARLKEFMLEHAKNYIANYAEPPKIH